MCEETPPTCLTELAAIPLDDHDTYDAVLCAETLDTSTCSADDMLEVAEQLECHCSEDHDHGEEAPGRAVLYMFVTKNK